MELMKRCMWHGLATIAFGMQSLVAHGVMCRRCLILKFHSASPLGFTIRNNSEAILCPSRAHTFSLLNANQFCAPCVCVCIYVASSPLSHRQPSLCHRLDGKNFQSSPFSFVFFILPRSYYVAFFAVFLCDACIVCVCVYVCEAGFLLFISFLSTLDLTIKLGSSDLFSIYTTCARCCCRCCYGWACARLLFILLRVHSLECYV